MKAAVLGSPISHSLSPVLHRAAYRALGLTGWTYDAIECDEPGLPAVLDGCGQDWAGLSLTMPLKRAVLPLLDTAEPLVADVGCANTVIFAAGARQGHNTDVPGMVNALTAAGVSGSGPVLLLGAGATACSALAAMRALGVGEVTVAVRDRQRAADLLAVARRLEMAVRLADFGRQPPASSWHRAHIDRSGWSRRYLRTAGPSRRSGPRGSARRRVPPVADRPGRRGRENRCGPDPRV